ncbi:hypothetical protein [Pseudomonas sp.]|uniref:hypothetical protein n=1 Tax=Pseudomonas sp. TaxID=306 RepID=UPI003F3F94AC
MNRFAAACVLGILSGCASPPPPTPTPPPYRQPVLTVQEVFNKTPLDNSVMRNGDTLSYQVHTPAYTRDGVPSVVQLQADCKVPDVKLLFLDNFRLTMFAGSPEHTPLTLPIPKELAATLASKPEFVKACARTAPSDWRIVHRNETARWVMIDINSLKTEGNISRFWGGFDDPALLSDKPDLQLFGQIRERYEVDCARKTYRVLSSFQLGPNNRISMGGVLNDPPQQVFAQGLADTQTLLNAACSAPSQRSTLPVYAAREKRALSYQIEPVPASVLKAIADLKLAPPSRTLKRTVSKLNITHFYLSKSSAEATLVFDTDAQSGQLREHRDKAPSDGYTVSFRGLLPLAEQSSHTDSKRGPPRYKVTDTRQLSFTGDWQRMPVGASLELHATKRERSNIDGEKMNLESVRCTVQRVLDAAQVNSELKGAAKELRCQFDLGQKLELDSKIYYLEDYAYFFASSSGRGGTSSLVTLIKAEE